MALNGSIDVIMENGNAISRNAANQISNYRDATKTVIHKVNRKLDKTYFINRLQFTELDIDKIRIKAKISPGENRVDELTVDNDIRAIMDYIVEALEGSTIYKVKVKPAE